MNGIKTPHRRSPDIALLQTRAEPLALSRCGRSRGNMKGPRLTRPKVSSRSSGRSDLPSARKRCVNNSVAQCRYLLSLTEPILVDLDDSHRALSPLPDTKTAGWLIGHLAVTGDFGRRLCSRPPLCPTDWRPKFNPGSRPSANPDDYPPMDQLRQKFREAYKNLIPSVANADAATREALNPVVAAQSSFPSVGEFVDYLLTGHLGYHVGQLVAWRASVRLGPSRRADAEG